MEKPVIVYALVMMMMTVGAVEKTSMYVKRSEVNDQSMSGSGYSYDGNDGKPREYSFEVGDDDRAFSILKGLGYDPFAEEYAKEYSRTIQKVPVTFQVNDSPQKHNHLTEYLGIYPHARPYAAGYAHGIQKGGKLYDDFGFSKKGETFDSGYKTIDAFIKGSHGKYNSDDVKSLYDQSAGKKQTNYGSAGSYASKGASGKVTGGGSFGEKKGHDKGQKTTGYHKVYHKDDYNKQHNFYDKADRKGSFKKFGDFSSRKGNADGSFAKGGRSDKGYANDQYASRDVSDKGKFEDIAEGFRKASGGEGFHQDHAGYLRKGGKDNASVSGFSTV